MYRRVCSNCGRKYDFEDFYEAYDTEICSECRCTLGNYVDLSKKQPDVNPAPLEDGPSGEKTTKDQDEGTLMALRMRSTGQTILLSKQEMKSRGEKVDGLVGRVIGSCSAIRDIATISRTQFSYRYIAEGLSICNLGQFRIAVSDELGRRVLSTTESTVAHIGSVLEMGCCVFDFVGGEVEQHG